MLASFVHFLSCLFLFSFFLCFQVVLYAHDCSCTTITAYTTAKAIHSMAQEREIEGTLLMMANKPETVCRELPHFLFSLCHMVELVHVCYFIGVSKGDILTNLKHFLKNNND